jgi:hypothetical protein
VGGPRRGREGRGVEPGERTLGLVEAPDQKQAPDLEIPRMRGVHPVAVRFERGPRGVERLCRPAQVARDQRDLGLGDDTPRAGHGLFWAEGTRRTSQQGLRANEIAELRHRDASKCECGRVVAQGDPVQCAEGITRRQRTRRGRDQRVHSNPATLVTPTRSMPGPNLSHDDKPVRRSEKATVMVNWTLLSPTFLTAVIDWAGAVVTVLAVGRGHSTNDNQRREER